MRPRNQNGNMLKVAVLTLLMFFSFSPQVFAEENNTLINEALFVSDTVVNISDHNLLSVIRESLNKPAGDITFDDMLDLTDLEVGNMGIGDLTGLEYASNLYKLDLTNNQITNLSPIAGLTGLTHLDFGGNQVNDITPLAGLNKLEDLKFWGNNVAGGDISIISGKTSIRNLHIDGINARDLTPVANLCNLEILWANMNQINDLSPLANLGKLDNLSLHSNCITDISALVNNSGFGEGSKIYLENNPLSYQANTDIQTLLSRGVNVSFDSIYTNKLSAGGFHSLAAKFDGTVVAWGHNDWGQTDVPLGLDEVIAVAAGGNHSLVLQSNGTVVAWGNNEYGQTDVPVNLTGVKAIAAGDFFSIALKSDGKVVAWGQNQYGQTNVPADLNGVVTIATGRDHSLALKFDGTVEAWGKNDYGQCNVPAELNGVIGLAAGWFHSEALKSDGTVVPWGNNSNGGQLNVPTGLNGVVAIASGSYHSLALSANGVVLAWGGNVSGATNIPPDVNGVLAIAAGNYFFSLALKSDGTVVAWGNNDYGEINVPSGLNLFIGPDPLPETIIGRVRTPSGDSFIPSNDSNAYVAIRRLNNFGDNLAGASINSDGTYSLIGDVPLPTGDYLLMAYADGSNNPYANAIPVTVHLVAGQTISQDISLTKPLITGKVLNPDGTVFTPGNNSYVFVKLRGPNGGEDICDTGINKDGSYRLGGDVPTGDYLLMADAKGINNPYSNAIRVTVHLVAGQTATQDMNLTNPMITGKVLTPNGDPFLPGNDFNGRVILRDVNGNEITDSHIEDDSTYDLGGDIEPGQYKLCADVWGNNNPYSRPTPLTITVTIGSVLTQDISLTNPIITGKVLKPDGSVFTPGNNSNVYVVLRRLDNSGDDIGGTGLKDDGSFRLGGDILIGDYLLMAYANGNNNPYANAIPVTVHLVAGETTSKDITLTNPIITGKVLKPDGSVFTPGNDSNVYVKLTRQDNTGIDLCGTGVNDDGSFKLGGEIPTGDYLLMADAHGSNNPYANSIPLTVHITLGQLLTKDISLTSPVVTGKILKPDSSAYVPGQDSWVVVCLRSSNGWEKWTGVYGDGIFRFGGDIPSGDYTLYTYPQGRNNSYANSIPRTINVVSAQQGVYDLTLTNPIIIGRVLKPDGNLFIPSNDSNVNVKLTRQDNTGDDLCDAFVNDDGSFRLGGDIHTGDYLLRADVKGSNILYGNAIPLTVQITVGQLLTQDISLTNPSNLNFSATPLVQIGISPIDGVSAGIFVGLKDIKDNQDNVVPNVRLVQYKIEVYYEPLKVSILDVIDNVYLGRFDINSENGKFTIDGVGTNGTTNFSKLFFLPIILKGSALDLSVLRVKYLSMSDTNLHQIQIGNPVDVQFQKGKIHNEGSGIQPNTRDAVAGLQYLAGLRDEGTELEQINPINMASIVGPDNSSTIIEANIKDVIALMQYLVGLRDINFQMLDHSKDDILIGGNLELTGNLSSFGQTAKNAIELAFQQVNDQGGILNGRKFKFIAEDNKSIDNEVVTAATKLIKQDKVVGIIGPLTTGGTRAEIPVATENSVPVITPSGSAPILTVNENGQLNQWIFRACFIDPFQAKAAAQFALGDKIIAKTAATIINQNDGYSHGLAAAFVQAFTNGGGQIINQEQHEHYVDGSDNYSTILANIKESDPDVVYLPGYYQEAGEIVKRARELGINIPFIGGDGWANAEIYNIAGVQAMNNTYYTDHVALDDPAIAQFIIDYQAKYGEIPDAWPALAFDAAKMFIKAIEIAGGTDTEKIRVALENLKDLQGVNGNITIDPTTHNPNKSVIVMENKEGEAVFLTKIGGGGESPADPQSTLDVRTKSDTNGREIDVSGLMAGDTVYLLKGSDDSVLQGPVMVDSTTTMPVIFHNVVFNGELYVDIKVIRGSMIGYRTVLATAHFAMGAVNASPNGNTTDIIIAGLLAGDEVNLYKKSDSSVQIGTTQSPVVGATSVVFSGVSMSGETGIQFQISRANPNSTTAKLPYSWLGLIRFETMTNLSPESKETLTIKGLYNGDIVNLYDSAGNTIAGQQGLPADAEGNVVINGLTPAQYQVEVVRGNVISLRKKVDPLQGVTSIDTKFLNYRV